MPTLLPSHLLALHLLTFLFFKIVVFICVHPLPANALAQARRAGWFPYILSPIFSFLFLTYTEATVQVLKALLLSKFLAYIPDLFLPR